jgi:3'(2'), 5'-bisphosphate nucleotidase
MNSETKDYIDKLESIKGKIEMQSRGSSLKICMVAEGEADIYPRFGPTMEWDTAAGHAVAIGAGCIFIQADEKTPFIYNKENLLNPYFIVKRDL